jgi:hypothetical protein
MVGPGNADRRLVDSRQIATNNFRRLKMARIARHLMFAGILRQISTRGELDPH